mmetsp:Transcript_44735/g.61154  ORF Transcript_44735/g.61154 Transcript_44735/m.61154 type:complete len:144 (-) Transcript_44735:1081-1512(-)
MALSAVLYFAPGLIGHPDKRVLVLGSVSREEVLASDIFADTPILDGTIFAGLPIADVSTEGGRAFVCTFFIGKRVELETFAAKLPSLRNKQDTFTILSRSLVNKLTHLQLVWPLYMPLACGSQWIRSPSVISLGLHEYNKHHP